MKNVGGMWGAVNITTDIIIAIVGVIGTILGLLAKGKVDDILSNKALAQKEADAFRDDLIQRCDRLNRRVDALYEELAEAHSKYLNLLNEHVALKAEHASLLVKYVEVEAKVAKLTSELETYKTGCVK